MARKGIIPIKFELTSGAFYTLWIPSRCEGGFEQQALLGRGDDICLSSSVVKLLAFLQSDAPRDFTQHPSRRSFSQQLPGAAIATPRHRYDLTGLPKILAGRVDYDRISRVDHIPIITRSIGAVADLTPINQMFTSYSVLVAT